MDAGEPRRLQIHVYNQEHVRDVGTVASDNQDINNVKRRWVLSSGAFDVNSVFVLFIGLLLTGLLPEDRSHPAYKEAGTWTLLPSSGPGAADMVSALLTA